MSEQVAAVASSMPAWAFLVPVAAGALVFLGRGLGRRVCQSLAVLGTAAVAVLGLAMAKETAAGRVLACWGNELRVDALSALLVSAIGVVGLLTAVYSLRYVQQPGLLSRVGGAAEKRLPTFYGLFLWFVGTMVWGCVTNNIIMLYVAVEATTLTSGLLVAFYWDRKALEAGYKYLMLLTIGITFALVGCVLIYAGAVATGAVTGREALLISEVRPVAHLIPPSTALIAVAFLVVGFGTKAGIAPFHPWLPDAHAEAPTPISVLLSGVMIKMAVYALARTVSIFYPRWPALTVFLVALGVFTMVLGIVMALAQDDLKRLLAYSSVSQIGYVLAGVGLGTYLGCYAGLYHLLNHAVIKALLFMCVGALIYATGARRISELSRDARADADHQRLLPRRGARDRRPAAVQRVLQQADRVPRACPRRPVVGGRARHRCRAADDGRPAAGGADGVLGSPGRGAGRTGGAGGDVGADGRARGRVSRARCRAAGAVPAARRRGVRTGNPGEVSVALLEKACKKAFGKALWVYHANAGACNGCDIEVINVLTPYYDAERFGIKLVGSPRHADVILVSGPVTRQVVPALKRLLDAVPQPAPGVRHRLVRLRRRCLVRHLRRPRRRRQGDPGRLLHSRLPAPPGGDPLRRRARARTGAEAGGRGEPLPGIPRPARRGRAAGERGARMSAKRKILVVDDDRDLVATLRLLLERAGYVVVDAPGPGAGMEVLERERPDLILLDVMMPDATEGFHFVWKLRRRGEPYHRDVPIIMLTAIHGTTDLRFYPDSGDGTYGPGEYLPVQEFLDKPVDPRELLERVARVLAISPLAAPMS